MQKAPFQIPEDVKEWIVKYSPWISLVLLVLPRCRGCCWPSALARGLIPFGLAPAGFAYIWLFVLADIVLLIMALPALFARKMSGWKLLFYARIVSIVSSLLSGAIVAAVVGGVISLYVLFQIRSKFAP